MCKGYIRICDKKKSQLPPPPLWGAGRRCPGGSPLSVHRCEKRLPQGRGGQFASRTSNLRPPLQVGHWASCRLCFLKASGGGDSGTGGHLSCRGNVESAYSGPRTGSLHLRFSSLHPTQTGASPVFLTPLEERKWVPWPCRESPQQRDSLGDSLTDTGVFSLLTNRERFTKMFLFLGSTLSVKGSLPSNPPPHKHKPPPPNCPTALPHSVTHETLSCSLSPGEGRLPTPTRVFFEATREKCCCDIHRNIAGTKLPLKISNHRVPARLSTVLSAGLQGLLSVLAGDKDVTDGPFPAVLSEPALCSTCAAHFQFRTVSNRSGPVRGEEGGGPLHLRE